jgi:hypothetical protein
MKRSTAVLCVGVALYGAYFAWRGRFDLAIVAGLAIVFAAVRAWQKGKRKEPGT